MSLAITDDGSVTARLSEIAPNRFWAQWDAKVPSLDAIASVEIEIGFGALRNQKRQFCGGQTPVEVVRVEKGKPQKQSI